jgi:hypothetical protein
LSKSAACADNVTFDQWEHIGMNTKNQSIRAAGLLLVVALVVLLWRGVQHRQGRW